MAQHDQPSLPSDLPLFARQPVFDVEQNIYGYELLYRSVASFRRAVFNDSAAATLMVVSGAFLLQLGDLTGDQRILVNFTRKTILDKAPYALPPRRTVVQVNAGETFDRELRQALEALKADGYLVAADGVEDWRKAEALLSLADLAIVDMRGKSEAELAPLADALAKAGTRLMAKRVENEACLQLARSLSFELFQGYYFKHPEVVTGRRLASGEAARVRLLRLTRQDQPDVQALGQVISSDVSLCYRLLAYTNSPMHGPRPGGLSSVDRAIVELGWKQLRNWLRVVALTDETPTDKAGEQALVSLQRADFLKSLAEACGLPGDMAGNLYTLGLFSRLDVLMASPMEVLLAPLPLDHDLALALRDGDGPLAVWLGLCRDFERGDWAGVERALGRLRVDMETAVSCYQAAMENARSNVFS